MPNRKVSFVSEENGVNKGNYEQNNQEWLFDDALALIGFGRVQYGLIALCGLTLIAILSETMGPMMLQTTAQCDLELDSAGKGLLTSAGFVGLVIPSYMWGYISDQYGRRQSMIYTLLATNVCAICSSFAPTLIWLCIARFCVGFFISASTGSVYPYLGEFNTVKNRPTVMAWCSVGAGIGLTYAPLIAWALLQLDFQFTIHDTFIYRPWRLIPLGFTVPGLTVAIILLYFPESPRFYMSQGNEDKALEVLKWMYAKNTGENVRFYPVQKLKRENDVVIIHHLEEKEGILKFMWNQLLIIVRPPYIAPFLICCYLFMASFALGGGLGLWVPEILNRLSKSDKIQTICEGISDISKEKQNSTGMKLFNEEICEDNISTEAFVNLILLGVYYTVGYVAISLLIKHFGRKVLLTLCLFGSAISGILTIWITHVVLQVILLSLFLVLTGLVVSVASGAAVMIFPTRIRATAICIIMMMGRISTAVSSTLIGLTIDTYCVSTMSFMVGIVIIGGVLNFFLE